MKQYLEFDPNKGYPGGANLFYECLQCGVVLPSRPPDSTRCECRNLRIDVDAGRFSVTDHAKLRIFRET